MESSQNKDKGGQQWECDSNSVAQYLVGTDRGNRGGATRTKPGQCGDMHPPGDKDYGGDIHPSDHRLLHIDD